MVDHLLLLYALRAQAKTLVVATTGTTTLEATATGYARAAGDFIADGFRVGMEVTPEGFSNNAPGLVTKATPLALTIDGGRTAEAAAAGRALTVGLPALRAYENVGFDLVDRRWAVDEDYLPGPVTRTTLGRAGELVAEPAYVLKLYGASGLGPEGLYRMADATLKLFRPNANFTAADGHVLQVRSDPAPYRGQLLPEGAGHSLVTVTIPLWVWTANIT